MSNQSNLEPLTHTHHPQSSQTDPKASPEQESLACQLLFKQKRNTTQLRSSCPAEVSVPHSIACAKRAGENEVECSFLTSATSQCRKSSVNVCSVSILQPPCTLSTAFSKRDRTFSYQNMSLQRQNFKTVLFNV